MERTKQAHHGRGAQRALVDIVSEIWLTTEEVAEVTVVLYPLWPVV